MDTYKDDEKDIMLENETAPEADRDIIAEAGESEVKARSRGLAVCIVLVLLLLTGVAVAGFLFIKPQDDTVQGQCDATEVRISGKLPGRVMTLYVQEGQRVHAGDTLVRIHSSLADAKMEQALAAESAAGASRSATRPKPRMRRRKPASLPPKASGNSQWRVRRKPTRMRLRLWCAWRVAACARSERCSRTSS